MNRSDFLVEIEKFFAIDERKEVAKILIEAGKLTLDEAVSLLQVSKRDIQRYMK
jgi:transcription initiation factor IIE alpha subunit